MAYDYEIQGVPLTDNRWASDSRTPLDGCWHMMPGTSVLPQFPGLRATQYYRPGQMGESQVQYAPVMPRNHEFRVRFLPVDHDPASPTYQREGRNWEERMRFLEQNINEFMFRTRLGATAAKGHLEIRRRHTTFEHFPQLATASEGRTSGTQTAVGRVLSDAQPEVHRDALYADYHFIFTLPEGTWYTRMAYRSKVCPAGQETTIEVPMGTAPVCDARIALRRRSGTAIPAGSKFLNDMGHGFELRNATDSERWKVIDTFARTVAISGTTEPNWTISGGDRTSIAEINRPQGSSLLINPGVSGRGDRIGVIKVTPTVACDVQVGLRPRWF